MTITVYTKPACVQCHATYKALDKQGLTYQMVDISTDDARDVQEEWEYHHMPVPLLVIESPYRQYAAPLAQFITEYRKKHGSSIVTVYLPQYIVGHWWESLLHNRRARRIAQQLIGLCQAS